MGGIDFHDQMTGVIKSRKQLRWYMRMFIKLIQMCIYNAYIIESHHRQHRVQGQRKRDLLQFKEELCAELVGNFASTHERNDNERRWSTSEYPERMHNVGAHMVCRSWE